MPRRAKYPSNANVWGYLAERRFDLDPDPPQYRPSPHEVAAEAFARLPQQDQDELTGWLVSNVSKSVPRARYDGTAKTGLLGSSTLAQEANRDLGKYVSPVEIAGAAIYLGFESITAAWTLSGLKFAAVWKDS